MAKNKSTYIREACLEDLVPLIHLGELFRLESKVQYPEIEPEAVFQRLQFFINDPKAFGYVVTRKGELLGFMCGYCEQYTFSFDVGAHSDLIFVPQKYRNTRAPLLLVKKFIEWSESLGARTITMDLMTGIKPGQVSKFLGRFGFEECGTCMVRHSG